MKELFDAISQVGFPIVVALLLLVRIESKMENLGVKIEKLTEIIAKLGIVIDERLEK